MWEQKPEAKSSLFSCFFVILSSLLAQESNHFSRQMICKPQNISKKAIIEYAEGFKSVPQMSPKEKLFISALSTKAS